MGIAASHLSISPRSDKGRFTIAMRLAIARLAYSLNRKPGANMIEASLALTFLTVKRSFLPTLISQ